MIESWGITCTGSIIILELGEILNLAAYAYFTAVAYEHFYIGSKNPKMLQKEAHTSNIEKRKDVLLLENGDILLKVTLQDKRPNVI